MKKKHYTGKKLDLGKARVITLSSAEQQALQGGATYPDNGCAGSNHCPTIAGCFETRRCRTYPFDENCVGTNHCTIIP